MATSTPVSLARFAPHQNRIRIRAQSFPLQQRRSHADWMSLLEEVFDEATDSRSRSVPFSELANLLLSFQTKKGHVMLQPKELEALDQYALDNALDFEVGPQDLMGILVQFGAADSPARQAVDDSALDQATPTHSTLQQPFGDSDGSPRSRIRTLSPTNYLDTANSPSTSTPQRPSKLPKRRSFLAALSSAGSPARSSPNAPTDLTEIVVASRETYLGVSLDGPLGEGWDPETLAIAIRAATKGLGVSPPLSTRLHILTFRLRQRRRSLLRFWPTR